MKFRCALKNIIVFTGLSMLPVISYAERTALYNETVEQYREFPGRYSYVMFGDSLTARGNWQDMFPGALIGNRGIGSDDTKGMLERVDDIIATHAKHVLIMAGTNDISRHIPPQIVAGNILLISKKLKAHGVEPIIQSTIFANKYRYKKNIEILTINKILEKESQSKGYKFVNLNRELSPGNILLDKYTIDGVHLNVDGYKVWKNMISGIINLNHLEGY